VSRESLGGIYVGVPPKLNNILTNILILSSKYITMTPEDQKKQAEQMQLANSPFISSFNVNEPHVVNLIMFLSQYEIDKHDTKEVANFICVNPESPCKYNVPLEMIADLMDMLNVCYSHNVPNHILECQYVNQAEASGLFFDFVFETKTIPVDFNAVILGFSRNIFALLMKYITLEDSKTNHVLMSLGTQNPVYPTEKNKYRSNFRIMIPSIMLPEDAKLFIYQRVLRSKEIRRIFMEKLNYDIKDCFHTKARNAPVSMLGSFTPGEENEPMVLQYKYDITISRENGYQYEDAVITDLSGFKNIIHDTSINYNSPTGYIKKTAYSLNDVGIARMLSDVNSKPRIFFTMEYDNAYNSYKMLSIPYPFICNIYKELYILDDSRFATFDEWLVIMKSLAASDTDLNCLAVMITHERVGKIMKTDDEDRYMTWDEFNDVWKSARYDYNLDTYNCKYSWRSLRHWATIDSQTQMNRYMNNHIKHMITYDIIHSVYQARLEAWHFAKYLHFMYGHMFISQNTSTEKYMWYEFVTPVSLDRKQGQLYKWREMGTEPDSLLMNICNQLQPLMNMIHSQMQATKKQANRIMSNEDPRIDHIKNLAFIYNREVTALLKTPVRRSIIKESCSLFKNNSFLDRMDQIPEVLGVGNGILEFDGDSARLIDYYHTYPISKYTDTNYIEYDPKNEYIKTVYEFLYSLFPEEERDAMDFLLYYFSTSLDGFDIEALFMIIHGGGSNGKSVLMQLFKDTLGDNYARKLPLSFITEQTRNKASGPDSALMDLQFARMVYYSESERNEKVNVAKVKELTGGETISGRGMYQLKNQNFKCVCNHIVTTNYRFVIESTDHGTWRRFLCYRFKFSFEVKLDKKNQFVKLRNQELVNKIKKNKKYHEAFLSILVHYHNKLYGEYGGEILRVPKPTIDKETQEYREREDIFERFISTRVVYREDTSQSMDEFVENFRANHSKQSNEKFVMQKEDLIHNFRNSSIGKYIKEADSGYVTEHLVSLSDTEHPNGSDMLFSKWRTTVKK
jgi:phage/plasmid-associated DNA primase